MTGIEFHDRYGRSYVVNAVQNTDKTWTLEFVSTASNPTTQFGYVQITNLSSPVALSVPAGASQATVIVEGGEVRYRCDGTPPTMSVGMPLVEGSVLVLSGGELAAEFIGAEGTILNIWYEGP